MVYNQNMSFLGDATIIAMIINIINTVTNIWWSNKLKSTQVNKEILASLREEKEEMEKLIKVLQAKKNQYKNQYLQQLNRNTEISGKLKTYEQFHKHS